MNRASTIGALLAAGALAGCFPIELDVTSRGELVISRQEGWFLFDPSTSRVRKVRDAEADQPVFARVSPDGAALLTVAEVEGSPGEFDFVEGPIDGGMTRRLLRVRSPTYADYSPDGRSIAITRLSTAAQRPGHEEDSLELAIVDVAATEVMVVARQVGPIVRWIPGGREVLAASVHERRDDGLGELTLVRIDVDSMHSEPLARVLVRDDFHLDVSPDGALAAVCALEVRTVDGELHSKSARLPHLFLIELASGAIRETGQSAVYGRISPDGDAVLVGGVAESGSAPHPTVLGVLDLASGSLKVLARDLHTNSGVLGEGQVLAGWIDNQSVYYFSLRSVYGRTGRALSLFTVRRDGTQRRCVQPIIDAYALATDAALAEREQAGQ